jgi:hypothetical protein
MEKKGRRKKIVSCHKSKASKNPSYPAGPSTAQIKSLPALKAILYDHVWT